MTDFIETLKSKRNEARTRMESAVAAATAAEEELRHWEAVLEIEMRKQGSPPAPEIPAPEHAQFTVDARTKEAIVRNVLKQANGSISAAEIIDKVKPLVSLSHVYGVLSGMRQSGEVRKYGRKYRYIGEPKEGTREQVGAVQ